MRGEVKPFASAGVLAVGLGMLIPLFPVQLPFDSFTVGVSRLSLVTMVLFAIIGVHPIVAVAVAVAVAVVLPLKPDPTLLMLAASIGWAAAIAVGPLSGLTRFLSSHFGTASIALTRRDLVFPAIVLIIAWPALLLCQALIWASGLPRFSLYDLTKRNSSTSLLFRYSREYGQRL